MTFLGYLIQVMPPLILEKVFRLTRKHFYHSFEAFSTLFKVTRVITLAPPMKFATTTQASGGIFLHGGNTEIK